MKIVFNGGYLDGHEHNVARYSSRNKDNWRSIDFVYAETYDGKIMSRYRVGWGSNNLLGGSANLEVIRFDSTDDLLAKLGEKAIRFVVDELEASRSASKASPPPGPDTSGSD